MKLHVGTSGYSYPEWKGNFYPEKFPNKDMLKYYSERFGTVEINNTFYRFPQPKLIDSWKEQVPANFKFVIKANQKITHIKKLKDVEEDTISFINIIKTLENNFGVILFQFPPYFRKNHELLDSFIKILPENTPAAFEFRHESWFDNEVYDSLKNWNLALCLSETDEAKRPELINTSDWGYLRLRRTKYTKKDFPYWIDKLKETGWKETYIFFKHEDEGTGPKFANNFIDLAKEDFEI